MNKFNLAVIISIAIMMMIVALVNMPAPTGETDSVVYEQAESVTKPRTEISEEIPQEDSEDEIGLLTPRMGIMPATGNIGIEVMPGLMIDMDGNIGVGVGF